MICISCAGRRDFYCWHCHKRRREAQRIIRDVIAAFSGVDPDLERRFRSPTAAERRRELDALRHAAEQECERRESDPTVN